MERFKYTNCTTEELRRFIDQRTKALRNKELDRNACLKLLKKLDKEPLLFHRFLDLPPELRNNVYELLSDQSQMRRVSRQLYRETNGIVR